LQRDALATIDLFFYTVKALQFEYTVKALQFEGVVLTHRFIDCLWCRPRQVTMSRAMQRLTELGQRSCPACEAVSAFGVAIQVDSERF